MKFIIKLLLILGLSLLLGLLATRPAVAKAPQQQNEDYFSEDITIKDNAIQNRQVETPTRNTRSTSVQSGRHSTKAEKQVSEEQLQLFLAGWGSPLKDFSRTILESPYWSTIIGICTIEQYSCTRAPNNNYWGIMCGGKVCKYASLSDGIGAISNLLARYDASGRDTIEEFRGYYCVNRNYPGNVCPNWESTVLRVKAEVEGL